jgi:hypothetical protein
LDWRDKDQDWDDDPRTGSQKAVCADSTDDKVVSRKSALIGNLEAANISSLAGRRNNSGEE